MTSVEHVTIWTVIKNSSYFVAFVAGVEWLGFNPDTIVIIFWLMVIDIITAIIRVSVNEGCREIKSNPLRKGIMAKFLLFATLFSLALATKGLGFDFQQIATGFISVMILGELYSILGNVHSARTGQVKAEFDAVAYMLGKVKALLDKMIR